MRYERMGREQQTDDEVSLVGERRIAALLDRGGHGRGRGIAIPARCVGDIERHDVPATPCNSLVAAGATIDGRVDAP